MDILSLILTCAVGVDPGTMQSLVTQESGGKPYIIGVNTKPHQYFEFTDKTTATKKVIELIKQGHSVDLGLAQINSANFERLSVTVEEVLDPCTNLTLGAAILEENYLRAIKQFGEGQAALNAALSAYNTGNFQAGIENGYVEKVRKKYKVPAVSEAEQTESPSWDALSNSPTVW